MTDAASPRRPARRWLLLPIALVLIAAAAWSAYWFIARGRLLAELDAAVAAHREEGRAVEWRARRVEGFPYRYKLVFDEFRVASPSGWAVEAPRFEAQANAYQLTRWVAAAPEGLTLVRPVAGPVRIEGRVLRASLGGVDRAPPRVSLEGVGLRFTPLPGSEPFFLAGAERFEAHLRPAPDAADAGALLLRVRGAQPRPAGVVAFVSGNRPADFLWDARLTELDALQGEDWSDAVRAWSRAGGRMEIREATLRAGDLRARNAGGVLSAGPDGRLRGRVVVRLNRPLQALSALTRIEQTDPTALGAASAITDTEGQAEVELAFGFEAGVTTIGPVAIGPAPKVF